MYSGLHDPARWVLPDALTEAARTAPHAPWITESAGCMMHFAEAESRSRKAAAYFHGLGVQRGERVGILMFNSCDYVCACLGLGKLAATSVLFNTELRGQFLRHQIVDSGIACLLIDAELLPILAERLLSGSGVVGRGSCYQGCNKGAEQGFAASARVVHELEEAEIKGQLVLRDAPVRAQPGT